MRISGDRAVDVQPNAFNFARVRFLVKEKELRLKHTPVAYSFDSRFAIRKCKRDANVMTRKMKFRSISRGKARNRLEKLGNVNRIFLLIGEIREMFIERCMREICSSIISH